MAFVFCCVLAILVAWVLLVLSAMLSLCWSRGSPDRRPALRLVLAIVPVLAGLFLCEFHLRWTMDGTTLNLSWPFVIPTGLGIVALVAWWRARRRRGG